VTDQTNPAGNKFTGIPIVAQFNPFEVNPSLCKVSYVCKDVARKDGQSTSMSCGEFSFDGEYNNQPSDG
jgi:hypothetical protein